MLSALSKIGHGDFEVYYTALMEAVKTDPELLAHYCVWNLAHGKVRDSKSFFPAFALRGLTNQDRELAENAVACALSLSPRKLLQFYNCSHALRMRGHDINGGWRWLMINGIKRYLFEREKVTGWWDRAVLQHRDSMKRLYRLAHYAPTERAQRILFDENYFPGEVFQVVRELHLMDPMTAAGQILNYRIPFLVAIGAVSKAKDEAILLALMERMSGNEIITNSKMLLKLIRGNVVLQAAYESGIGRARNQSNLETFKAGNAAESVGETDSDEDGFGARMRAQLLQVQKDSAEKLRTVDGDWVILADKSGSMELAIELARKFAALLTSKVSGDVYLIFFDEIARFHPVTGKSYDEILKATKSIKAQGNTSIGAGLEYCNQLGWKVDGIVIISDGGENHYPLFANEYAAHCRKFENAPPVYFFKLKGDRDRLTDTMRQLGQAMTVQDFTAGVDEYSMANALPTLKTNRHAFLNEVLDTPLLTIDEVFASRSL